MVTCASGQVRHVHFHTRSCRRCSVARSKVVRLSGSGHYQVREGVYDIARGIRRMTRMCSCADIIPAKRREERVRRSTNACQSESSSTICALFPIKIDTCTFVRGSRRCKFVHHLAVIYLARNITLLVKPLITFAESGKKRYFYFATTYLACYTFVPNNSRIMYYDKPSQSKDTLKNN